MCKLVWTDPIVKYPSKLLDVCHSVTHSLFHQRYSALNSQKSLIGYFKLENENCRGISASKTNPMERFSGFALPLDRERVSTSHKFAYPIVVNIIDFAN